MKKLDIVKSLSSVIVTVGVGAIVGNLIKMTTPVNTSVLKKLCIGLSGIIMGGMAADLAAKHTNNKIDGFYNSIIKVLNLENQN